MPLTDLQLAVARLLAGNRTPASHLAGGAAIHLAEDSLRLSNDLDYFHDEQRLVAESFARDQATLAKAGFNLDVILSQPGFVRAIVGREHESTKIEWAVDSAWRFFPAIEDPVVGYRLHPIDLSVNKVLALAGRDEPRDFLDAIYVHQHHLPLGALCWAAVGKDPGYNPEMLIEMLARKGRYRPEDFAELRLVKPPVLGELKRVWLAAIDEARALVRSLPAEDAGCLYFNPARGRFVAPAGDLDQLDRHRGSRGGIIPVIGEQPMLSEDAASRHILAESYGKPPPNN